MKRKPHGGRRALKWLLVAGMIVGLLLVALELIDEPVRRRMERSMNDGLKGYTVRLPHLDLDVLGFTLSIYGLTVSQDTHPDPPVAKFPMMQLSVQWKALLHAALVADLWMEQPAIHVNLIQLSAEAKDEEDIDEKGWQQAVEAMYPLEINEFRIDDGQLTYIDKDPDRPLRIEKVDAVARNIRNVSSENDEYPSDIWLHATVFDSGELRIEGHADFMREPYAGFDVAVGLERVDLDKVKHVAKRANLHIEGGQIALSGHAEYAPDVQAVHLKELDIRGVKIDYVHTPATAAAEERRVEMVREAAERVVEKQEVSVQIDVLRIDDATFAYVDKTTDPEYRLFLQGTKASLRDFSNRAKNGPAQFELTGQLMGSGDTNVRSSFFPNADRTKLSVDLSVEDTELRAMNDILRAYGNLDAVDGTFSLYTELSIQEGEISGYIKPLFEDMEVYDWRQEAGDGPLQHVYEGAMETLKMVLKNSDDKVATRTDISGRIEDPNVSTWQMLLNLLENAFVRAIVPGLEDPTVPGEAPSDE